MKSRTPFSLPPSDEDFPFSEDSLDPDSFRLMTRLHLSFSGRFYYIRYGT